MRKNVASQTVSFQMIAVADGSDVTSGTPAVYYTIDGGTQGTGAGAKTHEGNGQWSYVPAQAETNGAHVAFTMVLAAAVSQTVNVYPVSYDPGDAIRLGLTALPNAAADAAGGLPVSDAGGLDLDALNTAAIRLTAARAQVLDDWINAGRLDAILDIIAVDVAGLDGSAMRGTDSAALASVCTEARLAELDAANLPADVSGLATSADLAMAQSDLDKLTGADGATLATSQPNYAPSVAGSLMGLVNDAITLAKFDETTAFPLVSADSGNTEVARTGADSDTLETLSDQVDGTYTGTPPTAAEVVDEFETQSQADPTGFHVNVLEVGGTAQTANDNGLDINAIVAKLPSKTYLAGSTDADGGVDATELAVIIAGVASEISDALSVDTVVDLSNGAPPTTPTRDQMWMYVYSALINKIDVDASLMEFYNGAGTLIWKKGVSDDLSNYVETKGAPGT